MSEVQKDNVADVEVHNSRQIGRKAKMVFGGGLAVAALAVGAKLDLFSLPDLNPNPGQAVGRTQLKDIDVIKFAGNSADALGSAEIDVTDIKQEWIDKPDKGDKNPTVHETMYLTGAKYRAEWQVVGPWQPAKTDRGLTVTLPAVTPGLIETLHDPAIDGDRTNRAALQAIGGFFGADDTDDAAPRARALEALKNWQADNQQSGDYRKAVACLAIAGAAQKASDLTGSLSTAVQIKKYNPPRAAQPAVDPKLPMIEFVAPDPANSKRVLSMDDCLPVLDGMGYDPLKQATNPNSAFGLATHSIANLDLPPITQ